MPPDPSPEDDAAAPGDTYNVTGAAAHSRISRYRANSGEVAERSVDALLAWAKSQGLLMPDFVRVIPVDSDYQLTKNGRPVDAKYFEARDVPENGYIYWDEPSQPYRTVYDRAMNAVVVNVAYEVLQNDERFLHVLAHEIFEIAKLKKIFDECSGAMLVSRFYELTEPLSTAKNLHWDAWEEADGFIEHYRGETK
jgi:hypothetical protein